MSKVEIKSKDEYDTIKYHCSFCDYFSKWKKSFYGIYRERVWNGSLGEAEIYSGYGSKLKKENLSECRPLVYSAHLIEKLNFS